MRASRSLLCGGLNRFNAIGSASRACGSQPVMLRMEELANRNNRGELTDAEREQLEAYIHVGQVIGILQTKARISLKRSRGNGTE